MTIRETKNRLRALQQDKLSFHQLGDEVSKLINLIYGENNLTETLKVEHFTEALNNVELKSFIYLREPLTLKSVVTEANEFATIRGEVKIKSEVNFINRKNPQSNGDSRIQTLEKKMDSMVEAMHKMMELTSQRTTAPTVQVNPVAQQAPQPRYQAPQPRYITAQPRYQARQPRYQATQPNYPHSVERGDME